MDDISARTEFNGQVLLRGDGLGGPLNFDFRVGTGSEAADTVSVSIGSASVADLDASLSSAVILSATEADAARDSVEAAQLALAGIRSAVQGAAEALSFARTNGQSAAAVNRRTSENFSAPAVAIDLSRVLSERSADDAGLDLSGRSLDVLRAKAIDLSALPQKEARGEDAPAAEKSGSGPVPLSPESSSDSEAS